MVRPSQLEKVFVSFLWVTSWWVVVLLARVQCQKRLPEFSPPYGWEYPGKGNTSRGKGIPLLAFPWKKECPSVTTPC